MGLITSSASADSSVVGLWHFDEGSGLLASDSSPFGDNGTLSPGGVRWVPGVSGTALSFDGYTGSVDVPDETQLEPAALTVQAWVKRPGSPGPDKYIVDKGYNACVSASYGLYTGAGGGLEFYVAGGLDQGDFAPSPDAGSGVWDGNWHLATGTYDGTTVRLYIDGVQVGSGTPYNSPIVYNLPTSNPGLPNPNDLFFGASFGCDNGLDYPGAIDEVEIWNRALSATEVQAQDPPSDLAISPSSSSVVYGTSQTYTATALDGQGNDVGSVTPATTFTIAPDGTCSGTSCTPAAAGPHTVTGTDGGLTGTATLNVTPVPVTVTAANATRPYGAANPSLGATITGFVNGQTLATSGISGAAACTTTATPTSPVGTYPITCTQGTLAARNYSFPSSNFVAGTLTVTKATTSLSAPPISVINSILSLVPTFTATLTSGGAPVAGQNVAFSLSAAPRTTVCTGTTNSAGVAQCRPGALTLVPLLLSSSYTASFAGTTYYGSSSATAPVILLSLSGHARVTMSRLNKRVRGLLLHDLKQCGSLDHTAAMHGPRCAAPQVGH